MNDQRNGMLQRVQAKADDPKELKKLLAAKDATIRGLEFGLKDARTAIEQLQHSPKEGKPTPVLTDADRERLGAFSSELAAFRAELGASIQRSTSELRKAIEAELSIRIDQLSGQHAHKAQLAAARLEKAGITKILAKLEQVSAPTSPLPTKASANGPVSGGLVSKPEREVIHFTSSRHPRTRESQGTGHRAEGTGQIGKCERALLRVLAQRAGDTTSKAQLSVLSGYSITSSSFTNALGRLRSLGLVAGLDITDAGRDEAGTVDALPSGRELVAHLAGQLGKAERTLLEAIVDVGPLGIERDGLSEVTGYSTTSSSFTNAVGKLRTLELVSKGWPLKAAKELFS